MAREIIAAGGGRSVWRAVKQAFVDSLPVAPRHHPAQQQKKIWSGGLLTLSSSGPAAKAEMMIIGKNSSSSSSSSGGGGWREFVAKRANSGRFRGESDYSEGLTTLLSPSCRRDATILQRSAAAVRSRCNQLISIGRRTAEHRKTPTAFPGGVRNVHHRSSTVASLLVKKQMEQSRLVSLMTTSTSAAAARRNLSSGTTTWTERWNKLMKAVSPKQQPKATTTGGAAGAASVGLKSVSQARARLSEVASPVTRTFSHYREAVGLQIEAFWKRNYLVIVGLMGLGIVFLLWRLMFGVASTFISMSEGLAKFGFLALAAAMVIVGGVVTRARFTINPDAVYRLAMRRLNTSAAVLEVMGAPLSGSDLRAYIMSGGGLRVKNFRPRLASKRCFIIFPIHGADRRGLVSIEVKKKKGQYNFKLLAVDVPTAGADQRLYIVGDEKEYEIGGGLIHELRDPIVKAMAAQKEFEELDLKEDEDDERTAMEAEQLRAREELEKSTKEEEEREREELRKSQEELDRLVKEEPLGVDELEKPSPERPGKDSKPLSAQAG